jgi:hypothetical protein
MLRTNCQSIQIANLLVQIANLYVQIANPYIQIANLIGNRIGNLSQITNQIANQIGNLSVQRDIHRACFSSFVIPQVYQKERRFVRCARAQFHSSIDRSIFGLSHRAGFDSRT